MFTCLKCLGLAGLTGNRGVKGVMGKAGLPGMININKNRLYIIFFPQFEIYFNIFTNI